MYWNVENLQENLQGENLQEELVFPDKGNASASSGQFQFQLESGLDLQSVRGKKRCPLTHRTAVRERALTLTAVR
jgi:hypothetical protein